MDISVTTFPFFVFTVTWVEQFPYTVSCGDGRYSRVHLVWADSLRSCGVGAQGRILVGQGEAERIRIGKDFPSSLQVALLVLGQAELGERKPV